MFYVNFKGRTVAINKKDDFSRFLCYVLKSRAEILGWIEQYAKY